MKHIVMGGSLIALLLGTTLPAAALIISELETDGTSVNPTPGSAQMIAPGSFTPSANPSVFGSLPTATVLGSGGGDDVDFFSFTAAAGIIYFDIDDSPFSFDTALSLFDSSGTLLAFADDSFPEDLGSDFGSDSFLGVFTLSVAGTYFIAVSDFFNPPSGLFGPGVTFTDLTRPDGEFGGFRIDGAPLGDSSFAGSGVQPGGSPYTLHISMGAAAVPEPGTLLLLGSGVAGLVAARRRKRHR